MKKYCLLFTIILVLCSCGRECDKEKEEIAIWVGKTNLGGPHHGEPVSILWMEPVSGMREFWYPLKGFTDVKQMSEILVHLNFPETPEHCEFDTQRYLLICFIRRDLKTTTAVRVPFLIDNNEFVCPRGKDNNLYSLLISAEERENYFVDPKLTEQIIHSTEYKEHWKSQLTKDPNLLRVPTSGD